MREELSKYIELLKDYKCPEKLTCRDETIDVPDIAQMKYGRYLTLLRVVERGDDIANGILKEYYNAEIGEFDPEGVVDFVYCVVRQISKWTLNEHDNLKPIDDDINKRAGVDEFNKLKEFNIIDRIALRMHISHDEVLQLRYTQVYLMLWRDNIDAHFQDRRNKILFANAKK